MMFAEYGNKTSGNCEMEDQCDGLEGRFMVCEGGCVGLLNHAIVTTTICSVEQWSCFNRRLSLTAENADDMLDLDPVYKGTNSGQI